MFVVVCCGSLLFDVFWHAVLCLRSVCCSFVYIGVVCCVCVSICPILLCFAVR